MIFRLRLAATKVFDRIEEAPAEKLQQFLDKLEQGTPIYLQLAKETWPHLFEPIPAAGVYGRVRPGGDIEYMGGTLQAGIDF